jgi:hypothetical protein
MKSLLIAAAALGFVVAGQSAEAAGRRSTYYYPQSSSGYQTYSYPSSSYRSSQPRRMGIFGSIMEFERRKNEFLFGPR